MGTVRLFKHHVHTAFIWLASVEVVLFMLSVLIGSYLRFHGDNSSVEDHIGPILPRALVFAAVLAISMAAMGLYQPRMREGSGGILIRLMGAFIAMSLVMSAIFYLFPALLLWRGALAFIVATAFLFVLISRSIFQHLVDQDRLKRRVLVFGAGHRANQVLSRLRRKSDRRGFKFVGFAPVPGDEEVVDPNSIIRLNGSVYSYALEHEIDEVLVAVDDRRRGLPINDLLECKLNAIDVVDVVNFFERETGKIMLEFVTPGWMVFSDGFQFGAFRSMSKRCFDLVASFILLMGTWPIMLITILAIWFEDGFSAPLVYRQKRIGLNGEKFDVLKFRSMHVNAEKDGQAVWAQKNDNRITRVGKFIRQFRIDELPQIINVLAGDMGFVGPRPERPEFVNELRQRIPHYAARHQVKPGIAGWAQLCYPYGASDKDAEQKLQYDLYYVKNHSLIFDFMILLQTVEVVLFGKGAR
ncbi:MAG: TIGR03013 family PEP-CTERM/XrtA system glycosyltransferase [Pseudomonadales bacterium]